MAENEKVSVVIPCYNHEKYLRETVLSVLNSDYSPLEVIIVNDGSTDHSGQVAMELVRQYPGVRYIEKKNSGPSAARNTGIGSASGKYILPLDADDLISPSYIRKAVELLKRENARVVYCEAEFFGEKTGKWILPPFSRRMLAEENMIFCTALYQREDWLRCGGYDETMTWGWEDWEFWISMLKTGGSVMKVPEVGFFYRISRNSRRKSTTRAAKIKTVKLINLKHRDFVYEQLSGPLRMNRSLSRVTNLLLKKMGLLHLNWQMPVYEVRE